MKQFRFYCDKLHWFRSDIVQTVVKFVSVKYSLFQMQHEFFKQIDDCSNPFVESVYPSTIWLATNHNFHDEYWAMLDKVQT